MASPKSSSKPIIPRSELANRIIQGQNLVIYDCLVLDLTKWADRHPGGRLAVLHFVGRDATDEIRAYHAEAVLKRLGGFVVGRCEERPIKPLLPPISLGFIHSPTSPTGWVREGSVLLGEAALLSQSSSPVLTPTDSLSSPSPSPSPSPSQYPTLTTSMLEPPQTSLSLAQEHARSTSYKKLRVRMVEAGMFCPPWLLAGYGPDLLRYSALAVGAGWLYRNCTGWAGLMTSAVLLGAFWHQLTFLAHDAGHTGVTGKTWNDRLIGTIVADYIGGLSLGWWKDNHNIHHLVTNHPEHDPDIQHIPFFAISPAFFGGLWSTYYKRVMEFDAFSKTMIGLQHQIYYVVLSLARFNLYANSYTYLLGSKVKHDNWWLFEIGGVAFFWAWFGALLLGLEGWKMRMGYLLVSHIVTSPVHVQIVLSHFARSTEDLGPTESFPSRQLRTTMDVICSPAIEFLHGGLHLQVTHHLFPRIPRHNLRKASKLVKEFCREEEMEYAEYGFVEGNQRVLGVLKDVADQLRLLQKVAAADARGEIH